jgi:hypothetical protein
MIMSHTYAETRSLSASQGRPTAVAESTWDAELILFSPVYPSMTEFSVTASKLYYWKAKLAQIQNRFCGALNRHESVATRLEAFNNIDKSLTEWRDDIPIECRPEQEILGPRNASKLIAWLHLEYLDLMRSLHWASITCVPATENAAGTHLSGRLCASEAICLASARSFIKILNEYSCLHPSKNLEPNVVQCRG